MYVATVLNGALVLTTSQTHCPKVSSLQGKGVAAQAINSEALTAAALEGRDIWADSKTGKYEILLLRPETTSADEFDELINNADARPYIGYFAIRRDKFGVHALWSMSLGHTSPP